MKAAKKIDMTQGSIMKRVLLFALPICVGNVLQQLYGTVDTLVIGNFCGSVSLAAVGTSSQPVEILLCVFLGLGTGVSILVSQFTGRGDMESLKEIGATAISFLFLCSIPLTIIGQFAGPAFCGSCRCRMIRGNWPMLISASFFSELWGIWDTI